MNCLHLMQNFNILYIVQQHIIWWNYVQTPHASCVLLRSEIRAATHNGHTCLLEHNALLLRNDIVSVSFMFHLKVINCVSSVWFLLCLGLDCIKKHLEQEPLQLPGNKLIRGGGLLQHHEGQHSIEHQTARRISGQHNYYHGCSEVYAYSVQFDSTQKYFLLKLNK